MNDRAEFLGDVVFESRSVRVIAGFAAPRRSLGRIEQSLHQSLGVAHRQLAGDDARRCGQLLQRGQRKQRARMTHFQLARQKIILDGLRERDQAQKIRYGAA